MNKDMMMLVRYAAIIYGTYAFAGNAAILEPFVGAVVAGAGVLWGLIDRVIWPWLQDKTEEIKEKLD